MNGLHGVTALDSLVSFAAFSVIAIPSFRRVFVCYRPIIHFRNRCAKGYRVILAVDPMLFCNVEKLLTRSLAEVRITQPKMPWFAYLKG
jgi:hypothetical protein